MRHWCPFRQKKYNPKVLVDWYVKLARVAEAYAKDDRDRPDDFVEVRADLSRLNPEQLLALKQLALIASGGATGGSPAGGASTHLRRDAVRRKRQHRKISDVPQRSIDEDLRRPDER
jgi:hypothetical protein